MKKYKILDATAMKRELNHKPKNCKFRKTCPNNKAFCAVCRFNPLNQAKRNGDFFHRNMIVNETLRVNTMNLYCVYDFPPFHVAYCEYR